MSRGFQPKSPVGIGKELMEACNEEEELRLDISHSPEGTHSRLHLYQVNESFPAPLHCPPSPIPEGLETTSEWRSKAGGG